MTSLPNKEFAVITLRREDFTDLNKGFIQVLYFNALGELKWNKNISIPDLYGLMSVNSTKNGGLLIGGYSSGAPGTGSIIVSIDKNGDVLWQNSFTPTGNTSGLYSVSENANGEILAYGFYSKIGGGSGGHYLLHIRADGSVISCKSLYISGLWGQGYSAKDGGLYVNSHEGVQKYNSNGDLEWMKAQPEGFTRSLFGAVDDGNNFYCVSGSGTTYLLAKFNPTGKIIWQNTIDFHFNKFKIINNQLVFFNSALKIMYIFNTEGEFLRAIQFENTYHEIVEASLKRSWLSTGTIINQRFGIPLARTDEKLATSCSKTIEKVALTRASNAYTQITIQPVAHPYEMSSVTALVSSTNYSVDTLCYQIKPLPVNLGNDTTVCKGDYFELDAGNPGCDYLWSTGETTQKIRIHKSGTYVVEVKNAFGEYGADTITINVAAKPVLNWKLEDTEDVQPGDILVLEDKSTEISKRVWLLPNGETSVSSKILYPVIENGNYSFTLKITNAAGCTQERTENITVAYYKAYFPDAFSPNKDELNEVFEPRGYGIISYTLKVYNRWGEMIYNGRNSGWNGYFKSKTASEDLYFYTAEIRTVKGSKDYRSGKVFLIK